MNHRSAPAERRLHPRRPYRTEVVFEDEFGDGLFYVYSSDVSLGGLFLASAIPARVGSMLLLSFGLPGHKRPLRVTGQVIRRVNPHHPQEAGVGVRFVGLSGVARKRLEEFLSVGV